MPVVPVIKSNGEVRLCGDYKSSVNKALRPHSLQISNVNHLLSTLSSGNIFLRIDLAKTYLKLSVDEASAEAQITRFFI